MEERQNSPRDTQPRGETKEQGIRVHTSRDGESSVKENFLKKHLRERSPSEDGVKTNTRRLKDDDTRGKWERAEKRRRHKEKVAPRQAGQTAKESIEYALYRKVWNRWRKLPGWMLPGATNENFNRILPPRDAVKALEEFRPDCEFHIRKESMHPPVFLVKVEVNGSVLGAARGVSREIALNAAAEEALKASAMKFISECSKSVESMSNTGVDRSSAHFSWNCIASYALHKMFKEWKEQGMNVPSFNLECTEEWNSKAFLKKVEVPPDATKMHPCVLLQSLRPDYVTCVLGSIKRKKSLTYTVACKIDGEIFIGKAKTREEGRKEAVKTAVSHMFGVKYPH